MQNIRKPLWERGAWIVAAAVLTPLAALPQAPGALAAPRQVTEIIDQSGEWYPPQGVDFVTVHLWGPGGTGGAGGAGGGGGSGWFDRVGGYGAGGGGAAGGGSGGGGGGGAYIACEVGVYDDDVFYINIGEAAVAGIQKASGGAGGPGGPAGRGKNGKPGAKGKDNPASDLSTEFLLKEPSRRRSTLLAEAPPGDEGHPGLGGGGGWGAGPNRQGGGGKPGGSGGQATAQSEQGHCARGARRVGGVLGDAGSQGRPGTRGKRGTRSAGSILSTGGAGGAGGSAPESGGAPGRTRSPDRSPLPPGIATGVRAAAEDRAVPVARAMGIRTPSRRRQVARANSEPPAVTATP